MGQQVESERRQHPRYKCEGKVEIRALNSAPVICGTVTDLSAGGCYVELASSVPVGQTIKLTLTVLDTTLSVQGKVAVVHPMFGMGIVFTSCPQPEVQRLQEVLHQLSGFSEAITEEAHAPEVPTAQPAFRVTPQAACAILDQVVKVLSQKGVLTRADLLAILEKRQAS